MAGEPFEKHSMLIDFKNGVNISVCRTCAPGIIVLVLPRILVNFYFKCFYCRWDEKTGVVKLAKKLDKPQSSVFLLTAIARDNGLNPLYSEIPVSVEVRESNNKPPKFKVGPGAEIDLSEGSLDFSNPIATYTAGILF